jgi:hypothetical protein
MTSIIAVCPSQMRFEHQSWFANKHTVLRTQISGSC